MLLRENVFLLPDGVLGTALYCQAGSDNQIVSA